MCKTTYCQKEELEKIREITDTIFLAIAAPDVHDAFHVIIQALLLIKEHFPGPLVYYYPSSKFETDVIDMENKQLLEAAIYWMTTSHIERSACCLDQLLKNIVLKAK